MDKKEKRKLLGLLLINSGVFYIQRIKKRVDLAGWKNGNYSFPSFSRCSFFT